MGRMSSKRTQANSLLVRVHQDLGSLCVGLCVGLCWGLCVCMLAEISCRWLRLPCVLRSSDVSLALSLCLSLSLTLFLSLCLSVSVFLSLSLARSVPPSPSPFSACLLAPQGSHSQAYPACSYPKTR